MQTGEIVLRIYKLNRIIQNQIMTQTSNKRLIKTLKKSRGWNFHMQCSQSDVVSGGSGLPTDTYFIIMTPLGMSTGYIRLHLQMLLL